MSSRTVVMGGIAAVGALCVAKRLLSAAARSSQHLRLHIYDHCPFCVRVELILGRYRIPYQRYVYGYGDIEGASQFTGKKCLPVLEGEGVSSPRGNEGCLDESLEICSYLIQHYNLHVPCATGRGDIAKWKKKFSEVNRNLTRPRIFDVPIKDWGSPEDVAYAKNKYIKQGFDYDMALANTEPLKAEAAMVLRELCPLMHLHPTDPSKSAVNEWGYGMDDVCLLPTLRRLTCVKGIDWPAELLAYVEYHCKDAGVALYTDHAT